MPFIDVEENDTPSHLPEVPELAPEPKKPGALSVIKSAFRQENMVASWWGAAQAGGPVVLTKSNPDNPLSRYEGYVEYEEGFDPLSDENLEGYERHAEAFQTVTTQEQSDRLKARIDQELEDRKTISAAGPMGFVSALGASFLDPTVLLPMAGTAKKGASLLNVSARFAVTGAYSTGVQEYGLHQTQETRTGTESALNIAGATLLSGVLGGGLGALSKSGNFKKVVTDLENDMHLPKEGEADISDPLAVIRYERMASEASVHGSGSLSAASSKGLSAKDLAPSGIAPVMKTFAPFDPVMRIMTGETAMAKTMMADMAEMGVALNVQTGKMVDRKLPNGEVERVWEPGRAIQQPVESVIKRETQNYLGRSSRITGDAYARYMGNNPSAAGRLKSSAQSVGKSLSRSDDGVMTRGEFERQIFDAMNRGDASDNPFVQEAAQELRKTILQPVEDEMVDAGMFGFNLVRNDAGNLVIENRRPDVSSTAESYMPFLYSTEKIVKNPTQFVEEVILPHLKEKRAKAEADAAYGESQVAIVRQEREALNTDLRSARKQRRHLFRDADDAVRKSERKLKKAKGRKSEADLNERQSKVRVEQTEDANVSPEQRAFYRDQWRQIQKGTADDEPQDLLGFVRENGGVYGIEEIMSAEAAFPMNIARKAGGITKFKDGTTRGAAGAKHWDYMREAAAEAGFIPRDTDGGDFADALQRSASGEKLYRPEDEWWRMVDDDVRAMRDAADEAGVRNLNEFVNFVEGFDPKKSSPRNKGKASEAALRLRQASRRVESADDLIKDLEYDMDYARFLARHLKKQAPDISKRIDEFVKARSALKREQRVREREVYANKIRAGMLDDELLLQAERIRDRILHNPAGRLSSDYSASPNGRGKRHEDASLMSGRFKSRVLDLPYEKAKDWLENDLDFVMNSFVRSTVPDLNLIKRFGSIDMDAQLKGVNKEHNKQIRIAAKVKEGDTPETIAAKIKAYKDRPNFKKMASRHANEIKILEATRDRLRGTYRLPEDPNSFWENAAVVATTANTLRMMGGVVVSSIPDVARASIVPGITNSIGPVVRGLTNGLRGARLAAQELEDAGVGFEAILNLRFMEMADITAATGRASRFQKVTGQAQKQFGAVSLMSQWNGMMKQIAGQGTQNRILRAAEKAAAGKLSRKEQIYMTKLGIDHDRLVAFSKHFEAHGQTVDGARFGNSRAWPDGDRDVWLNAIRAETDRIVVTPGLEKPLVASSTLGRVLLQFQSYNFAATQRVAGAYAQGLLTMRDANTLAAMFTQIGLGMVVAGIKAKQYGLDTSEWSERKWLVEGVDRSGMLSVLSSINLAAEVVPGNPISLSALAGGSGISRRQVVNRFGALLGPTAGLGQDAFTSLGLATGEADEGTVSAARRLLPYQNIFYMTWLFGQMEASAGEAVENSDYYADEN